METIKIFLAYGIITVSIIGIAWSVLYFAGATSCRVLGEQTNRVTKYDIIAGCFIRSDKQYVPVKNWILYEPR